MSAIKLSVIIELPGSTMISSQECEKYPKKNTKIMPVVLNATKRYNKKEKKYYYKKDILDVSIRKCASAHQVIQMSEEAYENMTSQFSPDWFLNLGGPSRWKKMSRDERLRAHLDRTCAAFGGLSYTYTVFND